MAYNAAETLVELPDEAIDALLADFASVPSPRSHVILTQLGGAVARIGQTETAFAQRDGASHGRATCGGRSGPSRPEGHT